MPSLALSFPKGMPTHNSHVSLREEVLYKGEEGNNKFVKESLLLKLLQVPFLNLSRQLYGRRLNLNFLLLL